MGEEGRQPDETAPQGWLPPLAPGADAARRWHTVDEPTPGPRVPGVPPPLPGFPGHQHTVGPPVGGGAARDAWWRDQRAAPAGTRLGPGVAAPAATNGHAVAALTLGIAGLVLFVASGFGLVFVLNLPCSVLAWVFGVRGMRRADRGEGVHQRGMARAGMVLGVVGTVVGVMAVVAWALGFLFSEHLRDELQREWERQRRG